MGVFPGPRSAAYLKDLTPLISTLFPLLAAGVQKPQPVPTDFLLTAQGASEAEFVENAARTMLTATMESLFASPGHGGMRYVPGKCVFLLSVAPAEAASSQAAQPVP